MEKALVTICEGREMSEVFELSSVFMKRHAERFGMDFVILSGNYRDWGPVWQKLQIYNLLDWYNFIVYLDADCLISPECPDISNLVPEGYFGAVDEHLFFDRWDELKEGCRLLGINPEGWSGYYFNAGVMAVRTCHKDIFKAPKEKLNTAFQEQTYFNAKMIELGIPLMEMGWTYNCLSSIFNWPGIDKSQAYIIHFAGVHPIKERLNMMTDFIRNEWKGFGPEDG